MPTIQATVAKREINEALDRGYNSPIEFRGARINHNKDLTVNSTKIVLSEYCLMKMQQLEEVVVSSNTQERGTIFYGRNIGDCIVIDHYESDLQLADGIVENGAVDITNENFEEMERLTERTFSNLKPYNVVMHYHIHPSWVSKTREDGTIAWKSINDVAAWYSDNDYFTYAWLQVNKQPLKNKVKFLGSLTSVNYGDLPTISVVGYDTNTRDFNLYNNIYVMKNGKLFAINKYSIFYTEDVDPKTIHEVVTSIKAYSDKNNVKVVI